MNKKREWDNDKLEALRQLANSKFPDNPIKTLASMKRIIREQEKLHEKKYN